MMDRVGERLDRLVGDLEMAALAPSDVVCDQVVRFV